MYVKFRFVADTKVQYKDSKENENKLRITEKDCYCNDSISSDSEMAKYEVTDISTILRKVNKNVQLLL